MRQFAFKGIFKLTFLCSFSGLCLIMCLLSGCSPYKHSFNCPVPKGYPCTSMSRIHELIDEGVFTQINQDVSCKTCSKGTCSQSKQTPHAQNSPDWVEAVVVPSHSDESKVYKYVLPLEKGKS